MGMIQAECEVLALIVSLMVPVSTAARFDNRQTPEIPDSKSVELVPAYCVTAHRVGKLVLQVTNFGFTDSPPPPPDLYRCLRQEIIPGDFEYPKGSRTEYRGTSAFWVGGVVGTDTLVSTGFDGWNPEFFGYEFAPDAAPFGNIIERSIIDSSADVPSRAISEQDLIAVFSDSLPGNQRAAVHDFFRKGGHKALSLELTQRSYAWSYGYAEDFVLCDISVKCIGKKPVKSAYIGLYVDSDVGYLANAGFALAAC